MASDYYYLNNYRNAGKIAISRRSFEGIATIAANSVEGAKVKRRAASFSLAEPVRVSFKKGGKVLISLQVSVKKAENVREVCLQIQEKVATAVSMMSEAVPFGVEVKVVSVI